MTLSILFLILSVHLEFCIYICFENRAKGQIISECPLEIYIINTLSNKFDHIYYKKVPLSYDVTTFLDSRADICQFFFFWGGGRGIFGESKISKGHSEII